MTVNWYRVADAGAGAITAATSNKIRIQANGQQLCRAMVLLISASFSSPSSPPVGRQTKKTGPKKEQGGGEGDWLRGFIDDQVVDTGPEGVAIVGFFRGNINVVARSIEREPGDIGGLHVHCEPVGPVGIIPEVDRGAPHLNIGGIERGNVHEAYYTTLPII